MPYVRPQRVSEEDAKNFGVDWPRVVQNVRRAIARSRKPRDDFSLRDLVPANDDRPDDPELDALLAGLDDAIPADELDLDAALADLPLDFPDVRTPIVTDLDGNPVDEEPAPAPRRVSKNPKKGGSKPRKSFSRDMRNIKREEALSGAASYVIAANDPVLSVGEPLTPSSPSQKPHTHGVLSVTDDEKDQVRKLLPSTPKGTSKSTEKRRRADENDTRKAPHWDLTTDIAKGHYTFKHIGTRGGGLSFTLNLGPDVMQAANDNPAGWREWMHDRLVKKVAKFLGKRDLAWVPEFTKGGRLHIHGVIDATDDEKVQVERGLREAGGKWAHKDCEERQAHAVVMWGPSGWARYSLKAASKARRFFGCTSVLSATKGARSRARAAYEAVRATSA